MIFLLFLFVSVELIFLNMSHIEVGTEECLDDRSVSFCGFGISVCLN